MKLFKVFKGYFKLFQKTILAYLRLYIEMSLNGTHIISVAVCADLSSQSF